MCLICVEFNKRKMTKAELKAALPELVMFAKTEEEKKHFQTLQELGNKSNDDELQKFIDNHVTKYGQKIC